MPIDPVTVETVEAPTGPIANPIGVSAVSEKLELVAVTSAAPESPPGFAEPSTVAPTLGAIMPLRVTMISQ